MKVLGIDLGAASRAILRPSYIPATIALCIIVVAGLYAEHQNQKVFDQAQRAEILNRVSVIRAKLEGNLNGNIQLVRGLVATLATEPEMQQSRFAQLASNLFANQSQLRNIAAAPDFVISMQYPLEGNRKALGLNYLENEQQRASVIQARDTGDLVLAGPVELVQGGRAFIGRFPVFSVGGDNHGAFWGIVSAVIDADRLYFDSGLRDPQLPIEVALIGRGGDQPSAQVFFGDPAIVASRPVSAEIVLPAASWQIAAIPRGGWKTQPANLWLLRVIFAAAGAMIVVPMLMAGRLIEERRKRIGELRAREAELQRLSRRLGLALETSEVGVWEMDLITGELVWDARMNELYGLPQERDAHRYEDWRNALHPHDLAEAEKDFADALQRTGRYSSHYRVVLPSGETRHIRALGAVYVDPDGAAKIVGVNWDVTADVRLNRDLTQAKQLTEARNAELEAAKSRIEHNALHDSLTGLPNRRYLDETLAARERSPRSRGGLALLHIDLDRFKQINDTLGHVAGDAMLVHAAAVLRRNVESGDFVARVGGDEFVVLCELAPDAADSQHAARLAALADRIIWQMRQPVPYEGHECRFGVSVGIATQAEASEDPRRLMVNADIALYRAKRRGRSRYQFFNEDLEAEIISTKRTADEILNALERNEFTAYYQPQFDANTLEIIGVEALARWNHPARGVLTPDAFLKTAEELNVVSTIDRLVLEQALRDLKAWNAAGLCIPKVSVNVSARRLRDEELISSLVGLQIQPGTVSFELVESIFLDEDDDIVTWNVDRIKELGIDIEIDDFGTGYASIVSLLKLKPQRLKIDRQLVAPVADSPAQRHLVKSIVNIGKSLGIEVLAEGVETMAHARMLRDLGCHALQGYALARPMSGRDLDGFARARSWRAA